MRLRFSKKVERGERAVGERGEHVARLALFIGYISQNE